MKTLIRSIVLLSTIAAAACSQAGIRSASRTIVVETPSRYPILGQSGGSEMFLHDTSNGRTLLYVESNDGRSLSILDVSDPANIRRVCQAATEARSPFFYVQDVSQDRALVRFRDAPGLAVLDFSSYKRPALRQTAALAQATQAENLGGSVVLLSAPEPPPAIRPTGRSYEVLDTSRGGDSEVDTNISGVTRRLTKTDTGTLFLLADTGLTVVRNLRTEEELALHRSADRQ